MTKRMNLEEDEHNVLFVPYEKLDVFYNLFVIGLFLKRHDGVRFQKYISNNCFRALYGNEETTVFLFNAPKDRELTDYLVFQRRLSRKDDRHVKMDKEFVKEYMEFLDNPYRYIRGNLFDGKKLYSFFALHNVFGSDYDRLRDEEKLLYKYKMLNTKAVKESDKNPNQYLNNLLSGILTFVNPKHFNDPFDCDCEIPLGLKKYYTELIYSIGKRLKSHVSKNEIQKKLNELWDMALDSEESLFDMIQKLIRDIYKTDSDQGLREQIRQNAEELLNIKEAFRVLCMSVNPRDILMWGYYCNGGEGVSVEFKQKCILDSLKKENNKIIFYGDVRYRNTDEKPRYRSSFSTDSYDIMKFVIDCIFSKYYVWSHENERRFVMLSVDDFDTYFYDMSSVRETCYLGVKTSFHQMNKLNCPCGKYIQLKKHPTKYAIVDDV